MKSGKVIRSDVNEVNRTGRNTQGVTLAKPDAGDEILSIARNEEADGVDNGDETTDAGDDGMTGGSSESDDMRPSATGEDPSATSSQNADSLNL